MMDTHHVFDRRAVDDGYEPPRLEGGAQGGFAGAPYLATAFVVQFLTFLAASGLLYYSFRQAWPTRLGRSPQQQFFGLRIALSLYVVATFFGWLFMAFANINGAGLNPKYLVFSLFPLLFLFAAEVTLLHTLIRLAWHPLVHVCAYKRARSVGIGLSAFFGVTALILWAAWIATIAFDISADESDAGRQASLERVYSVSGAESIAQLIYWSTGALWGLVVMGASIDALRKSRGVLKNTYRVVPKLIIPASILWFTRYIMFYMFDVYAQYGIHFMYPSLDTDREDFRPMAQSLISNGLLLIVFVLCSLCFRTNLLPFYSDTFGEHVPAEATGHGQSYHLDATNLGHNERAGHGASGQSGARNAAPSAKAPTAIESDTEREPSSFV